MLTQSNASRNGHSKPTRNADLRHAQSIGRQRAKAEVTPQHKAQCIAQKIRKRLAEGQPIEDLTQYGLDDATWAELVAMLSNEELAAVNGQSVPAADEPTIGDTDTAPAPKAELPGWRSAEPRFVHSLKWFDQDGIEHLHVVRSDDLDDVLRQVRTVKAFIAASKARARDEKPAPSPEPEQADSAYDEPTEPEDDDYCPTHGRARLRPSKFGGVFCSARTPDGYCKFKSGRRARK
jgi:hypothetical protein